MIHEAVRSSIQEIVAPMFVDLQMRVERLEHRMDRIDKRMDGIEQRMDRIELRMDRIEQRLGWNEERSDRLDQRLDAFAVTLNKVVEGVAALKRDRDMTEDILRRVGRLEDRLLGKN
ncbi:MAG TPA: hypothetical protein VGL42_00225 [Opitutaceae bacterium]|jgi:chromosome segregation ATPase